MSVLTQAEAKRHLLLSAGKTARTQTYTDLLGFRSLSRSRSRSGPQVYPGRVGDFYIATKTIAEELSQRYNSWEEFYEDIEAQENFTQQKIEDLIGEYGPIIWNDGRTGPFLTMTDNEDIYPRYLIYNNQFDRVKIRTFVYCLTLQRTSREIRTTGSRSGDEPVIKMEPPYAAARSPMIGQFSVLPPDPDVVFISSNPTTNRSLPFSIGGTSWPSAGQYQVPVAQMVPNIHMEGTSSSFVMSQIDADRATVTVKNDSSTTEKSPQPNDMLNLRELHTSVSQASDTASEDEDIDQRGPSQKRRRFQRREEAGTSFRTLQSYRV
ncbi:hypothetical protein ACJQWK_03987 [Exserohilum turcicum]|uniref:Uncharacterized protein n=1 Tax=Exserohilum turcicum (strain 28A) TaxID=671987 RepID=R0KVX5_EXST2|nr:uncharacterized protein SETTUDRAFT_162474 [Exserohilum turcica Et28A]EOA91912.1 hypothetical protein SETTUDRAFT_162474 [Exserohilum turcica Et28A]